ncbi:MAG: T9SS type A sorting domain-containing protein [Bacteroidales bacterium]|nr:T9SS type A sorting domain-containing protein [Bacteroidales bacterium]
MNVKRFLFQVYLALMPLIALAQTTTVSFGYDRNGNRTARQLVIEELLVMKSHEIEELPTRLDDNSFDAMDIKLFPNPTYGQFSIELTGLLPEVPLKAVLITENGNIITVKLVSSNRMEFDISNQADGVYLLQLFSKDEMRVWKIIKQ